MKEMLVKQAVAGKRSALEKLLAEIYPQLYKTAFLYVKNEPDALDIVQEAVIKIITKITTLEHPEYFTTWAIRVVIRTAMDFLRKKTTVSLANIPEESSTSPLALEDALDIYQAIARLPQHLQEITILHYFYGKKLPEISLVFDEPLGTVKYKLHEARLLLRDYLEEDDNNEDQ